jgi:hypothetical protein
VVTIARLDTAANTDVVSPKLAAVLKSNKVQWSAKGGAFVEVCGASSVRPAGFLSVPIAVSSRQLGLPRRLHLTIDACIMDIRVPGQDEPKHRTLRGSQVRSGLGQQRGACDSFRIWGSAWRFMVC